MKLEHLEQLVMIEKYGSLSKAAKELYTTHSTLSSNLSNLETEIGVRLFERTPMGVVPTAEGKEIVQIARSILDECNQILSFGKREKELHGSVNVLIAPAFQFLYSEIMLRFQQSFPEATLRLEVCLPSEIITQMTQGKANIGLTLLQDREPEFKTNLMKQGIQAVVVGHCTSKLFVNSQHTLAAKQSVLPSDLCNEQFVTYSEYHWNAINAYIQAKHPPFIIEDSEIVKQMIYNGTAIGYFPDFLAIRDWRFEQGLIRALPILEMGNITEKAGCLLYPSKRRLTLLEQAAIKLLHELLSKTL